MRVRICVCIEREREREDRRNRASRGYIGELKILGASDRFMANRTRARQQCTADKYVCRRR